MHGAQRQTPGKTEAVPDNESTTSFFLSLLLYFRIESSFAYYLTKWIYSGSDFAGDDGDDDRTKERQKYEEKKKQLERTK